jgi:parallel beta-helix repeat protein
VTPVSNLAVSVSTKLCPGSYQISDPLGNGVIQITGNNVVLDISGVTLIGSGSGFGIKASGVSGATIRSSPTSPGSIQGFAAAILLDGGSGHYVTGNVLSNNATRPVHNNGSDFLRIWDEFDQKLTNGQIGDGVVLRNVSHATIANNQMEHQQNGISLFESNNVTIQGNNCSNNQGWGISLLESSNNTIIGNTADNVNLDASTYCKASYNGACDTAGILVIKNSNDNVIQDNSFQNGGDGIFSAAVDPNLTHYGADRNSYLHNDVSNAKAHGIEATFAVGLDIENNTASNVGIAGIWIGGSSNSMIRGNTVSGAGSSCIKNQGAYGITIDNNALLGCNESGIDLTNIVGVLASPSSGYVITNNVIQNNKQYGIDAEDTVSMTATGNVLSGNGQGSMRIALKNVPVPQLTGPIDVNDNDLNDASMACGGVRVSCGCSSFDGDQSACSSMAGCTYFGCSSRCMPWGTTSCAAGCGGCTSTCRDHDGNVDACNAAGCAYFFCSNSCYPSGTSIPTACPCAAFNSNQGGCNAAAGCSYHTCSGQCFPLGTPDCLAACTAACNAADCPIGGVTNITSNWWGTTNQAVINAAICGAQLNPVPYKTAP